LPQPIRCPAHSPRQRLPLTCQDASAHRASPRRRWRLPFSRLACASSSLTASARDAKRGPTDVAHVDSYLQSWGGEICLILPPSERTCRRLSQAVASRETLRNRKVINVKSAL
jgi:hypothetical protein